MNQTLPLTVRPHMFIIEVFAPHGIDWVKDRVRWYWENKLSQAKPAVEASGSESSAPTIVVSDAERKPEATTTVTS